jgi:hypothetical protein
MFQTMLRYACLSLILGLLTGCGDPAPLQSGSPDAGADSLDLTTSASGDHCYSDPPTCSRDAGPPWCRGGVWKCPFERDSYPPSGEFVGCDTSSPCPEGQWCDYRWDLCDTALAAYAGSGVCRVLEPRCPTVYIPTCGCDRQVYDNECIARAAGMDLGWGLCKPPEPNLFPCGPYFCDLEQEYCVIWSSDLAYQAPFFECLPLPDGCTPSPGDCSCVEYARWNGAFGVSYGGCTVRHRG